MNAENYGVPAGTQVAFNPNSTYDSNFVDNACDNCEKVIDSVINEIVQPFLSHLENSENKMRELVALVLGGMDAIVEKVSFTFGKCCDKIQRALTNQIGDCYGSAAACGVIYPTDEQVSFGLQTGRFLESIAWQMPVNYADSGVSGFNGEVNQDKNNDEERSSGVPFTGTAQSDRATEIEKSFELFRGVPIEGYETSHNKQAIEAGLSVDGTPSTRTFTDVTKIGEEVFRRVRETQEAGEFYEEWKNKPTPEVLPQPTELNGKPKTPFDLLSMVLPFLQSGQMQPDDKKEEKNKKTSTSKRWLPTNAPDWNKIDACNDMQVTMDQFANLVASIPKNLGFTDDENGDKQMPDWFKPIYDNLPMIIDDAIYYIVRAHMYALQKLIDFAASGSDCNKTLMFVPSVISIVGGFLTKWFSTESERFTKPYTLTSNYICPQELPSPNEATAAYLMGTINFDTWTCWIRANNFRPEPQKKILEAGYTKPNISDFLQLWMRKHIGNQEWHDWARRSGVMEGKTRELYEKLVEAWPGMDDVVRFMTRDVDDENLVERFGMDDEFVHKWTGKTQDYGTGLGMTTELAKRYWRAHWQLPSPTQLYQMLHRLRPGRVPKEIEVDEAIVKTALQQNDMLPYWVPREVAIAYAPLTRTDTQRAYFIGALKEKQVYESYLDLGYNERDAKILTDFTKKLKFQYVARQVGLPTAKDLSILFSRYEISEQEMNDQLQDLGYGQEEQDVAKLAAQRLRKRREQSLIRKGIKRKYLIGDHTAETAKARLIQNGFGPEQAVGIVNEWEAEREAKGKAIPAASLCRMRERNLIGMDEQLKMLVGLGYSIDRAKLIASDCGVTISDRQMRRLTTELKRQEQKLEAERARAERIAKDIARQEGKKIVSPERILEKTVAKIESDKAKELASSSQSSVPEGESKAEILTPPDGG